MVHVIIGMVADYDFDKVETKMTTKSTTDEYYTNPQDGIPNTVITPLTSHTSPHHPFPSFSSSFAFSIRLIFGFLCILWTHSFVLNLSFLSHLPTLRAKELVRWLTLVMGVVVLWCSERTRMSRAPQRK